MGVDHGGLYVLVTEEFLDGTNIVSVFEQVGGKGVTEGVRGNKLIYFCEAGSLFDSPLEVCFAQVVTLFDAAYRIGGNNRRRKDVLPGKFTVGIGVFPFKGIGKVDRAVAFREVKAVLGSYQFEMEAQRFEEDVGKHGDTVVFTLAITYNDLTIAEVQVFDAQAHDFHQAQSAAVHDLGHQFIGAVHISDHSFRLLPREDGGNVFGPGRTNGDEGSFIQLDVENIAIQKEDGADRLVLCRSGDGFPVDDIGDEVVDLCNPQFARMPFVMVQDVPAYPGNVGFFGTQRIMAVAKGLAILIEQFFPFSCRRYRWRQWRIMDVRHVYLNLTAH